MKKTNSNVCTVLFTGLSSSGKTTIANGVSQYLSSLNIGNQVIDGQEISKIFYVYQDFTEAESIISLRRVAYIAQLLNRHNIFCLIADIAPYRSARELIREMAAAYLEIYIKCPLSCLVQRDTKGFYAKYQQGLMQKLIGLNIPYEEPQTADLIIQSDMQTPVMSIKAVVRLLEQKGFLC